MDELGSAPRTFPSSPNPEPAHGIRIWATLPENFKAVIMNRDELGRSSAVRAVGAATRHKAVDYCDAIV